MKDKFHDLIKLGVEGLSHIDGSLIDHLKGTKRLLEQWG